MRPKDRTELLIRARVLGEEFESCLASPTEESPLDYHLWRNRWQAELNALRLGFLFLTINKDGEEQVFTDQDHRFTHAAEIAIGSLEKVYSSILAIDFKKRNR